MNNKVYIILFLLCIVCNVQGHTTRSRSRARRLVSRFINRLGSRAIVDGRRMYWYCRRGAKLAICRRYENQMKYSTKYNKKAKERDLCASIHCVHGKCVSNKCICQKGWSGNRCADDIDECKKNFNFCGQLCINMLGSYRCACRPGYQLHSNGKSCSVEDFVVRGEGHEELPSPPTVLRYTESNEDDTGSGNGKPAIVPSINEPILRHPVLTRWYLPAKLKHGCEKDCRYKCVSENGVERCICPRGLTLGSDNISCVDYNECSDTSKSVCPVNQECRNTYGGYVCKCQPGYTTSHQLSGKTCRDVNECFTGEHLCGRNAYCLNTPGSYTCNCLPGYEKNGAVCKKTSYTSELDLQEIMSRRRFTSFPAFPWSRKQQFPSHRPELE